MQAMKSAVIVTSAVIFIVLAHAVLYFDPLVVSHTVQKWNKVLCAIIACKLNNALNSVPPRNLYTIEHTHSLKHILFCHAHNENE